MMLQLHKLMCSEILRDLNILACDAESPSWEGRFLSGLVVSVLDTALKVRGLKSRPRGL
jgi:hypothetical protein